MKIVSTDNAPKAIGPYSQAIVSGDLVFCSGQIALSPETGELVGNSIEEHTEQVLKNLQAVLEEAECTFNNVVKTTMYLTDLSNFAVVNNIYAKYFGDHKPARVTIEISALPKGSLVEIECIARKI